MRMQSIGAMGVVVALCAVACGGRSHLSKGFGESVTKAFAVQQERGAKPPAEAVVGLDAQEAAITTDNYRAGLTPEGKQAQVEPTILVAPPTRDQPVRLAPSVPPRE